MNRITAILAASIVMVSMLSANSSAQDLPPVEKNFTCTEWLVRDTLRTPEGKRMSHQGMEMHGRWLVCLGHNGYCNLFDMRKRSTRPQASFKLATFGVDNHANNAEFGIEKAPGGYFPVLYVSNGKVGCDIEWVCYVESIKRKGKEFSSELVQSIWLDGSDWESRGYTAIFGAPSWLVDRKRGELWVFSAVKRTVRSVTKTADENKYVATKFRLPKLSEGAVVNLSGKDILDQVVFPYDVWFTQAGCVRDGRIYYCYGVGKDPQRPSAMREFDTDRRCITRRWDLPVEIPCEMEDLVLKGKWMYVNTNPVKIYKLSL